MLPPPLRETETGVLKKRIATIIVLVFALLLDVAVVAVVVAVAFFFQRGVQQLGERCFDFSMMEGIFVRYLVTVDASDVGVAAASTKTTYGGWAVD